MRLIFIDTETTGLPRNLHESYKNIDNWPRLVQLSWIVYDDTKDGIEERDYIVRPDGFEIPQESSLIHGITNQKALNQGNEIVEVFKKLLEDIKPQAFVTTKDGITSVHFNHLSAFVGHNLSFDMNVIMSEMHRLGMENNLESFPLLDTMILGMKYCGFTNVYGSLKYPTLSELYRKLFAKTFDGAHNSLLDIQATYECFWEMINLDIIQKKDYVFLLNDTEKKQLSEEYLKRAKGKEKLTYLTKSSELGNTQAMYQLAQECITAKEYIQAEMWLNKILESLNFTILNNDSLKEYKAVLRSLIKVRGMFLQLYYQYLFKGESVISPYKETSKRAGLIFSLQHFHIEEHVKKTSVYEEKLKQAIVGMRVFFIDI